MKLDLISARAADVEKERALYAQPRLNADKKDRPIFGVFSPGMELDRVAARQAEIFALARPSLAALAPGQRLIVPVSARAMAGKEHATKALAPLKGIGEEERGDLIAEMFELPAKPTLEGLEAPTVPLLFFIGGFIARVDDKLEDATVFANCNYLGLSVDLGGVDDPEQAMRRVWAKAEARRLKTFFWNIPDKSILDVAARLKPFAVTMAG